MLIQPLKCCPCKKESLCSNIQREILEKLGIKDPDWHTVTGPDKRLANGELGSIEDAYRVHGVRRMVVLGHISCAKFAQERQTGGEAGEIAAHFAAWDRAEAVIEKDFPDMQLEYHLLGAKAEILRPAEEV